MKNYQKIFITMLVGILIIPQITSAVWWNPIGWFDKTDGNGMSENNLSTSMEQISASTQKEIFGSADDSVLQKRIDILTKENIGLKSQLSSTIYDLNMCKNQNTVSAISKPSAVKTSTNVESAVDSREIKLKSLDSEILKLLSELGEGISSYDISASVKTPEIESINVLVGKIDSILALYRYIDGSKMLCIDITPIAARTPDVSIYPFSKVAVAVALPNISGQISRMSSCLDLYIQNRNYVSGEPVVSVPVKNLGKSVNSSDAAVSALQQQVLDIKDKYYKDVQTVMGNSYYSGSVRQGLLNKMRDEVNAKIAPLQYEIGQLELNNR